LEVQGRTALAPRRLTPALAWLWARRWAALALVTVVTVAATVVDAQPVRSPWWTYADADASYTASALNLLLGNEVRYVDHPGTVLVEATAVVFGIDALLEKRSLSHAARLAYVDAQLLDLDDARAIFRGIAIAIYLGGALLSFLLAARLFGHWTWGLAAGLLWVAAPGLIAMSIQLRPDVLLAVACIVFAFLVGRALETRSAVLYGAAALTVGLGFMVKLHAVGLLAPLAVAALWRPPPAGWAVQTGKRARDWIGAHRTLVATLGALWFALAVALNWERFPFTPTDAQWAALAVLVSGFSLSVAVLVIARRRRFVSLVSFLAAACLTGVLIPVSLDTQDGLRAIVYVSKSISGRGVNEGVDSFSTPFSEIGSIVGMQVMIIFVLAAAAGILGLVVRNPQPVVWSLGALVMGIAAFARAPNVHYFAPAFALSIFAVLWLLHRGRRHFPLLAWVLVLYVAWPAYDGRTGPAAEAERFAGIVRPSTEFVDGQLGAGEVALVPSYWPFADARFFELVQIYVEHTPEYPYRYLPTTAAARDFAATRGWRPRWFVGPQASSLTSDQSVTLGEWGDYTLRRAPGGDIAAELVSGPGITSPLNAP
jgi:hypothetical protein